MWEKIEFLCEGTEDMRSNQEKIMLSKYEGFMAKSREGITEVFKRFNKLMNDLQLQLKYNKTREINLKFLLTLPDHLEQKISAIIEGSDLGKISLEVLYVVLKMLGLKYTVEGS